MPGVPEEGAGWGNFPNSSCIQQHIKPRQFLLCHQLSSSWIGVTLMTELVFLQEKTLPRDLTDHLCLASRRPGSLIPLPNEFCAAR